MPKKKASSPRKRSTKAATQTRSTISSTIDETPKTTPTRKTTKTVPAKAESETASGSSLSSTTAFLLNDAPPAILRHDQQAAYISLLSRGASPAAACSQLQIRLTDVIWSLEQQAEFRSMVQRVQDLLSQNVAAALYRSAMEGSVSAQQNYLRAYPPSSTAGATSTDSDSVSDTEMTEEELVEYLKSEAAAFLAQLDQENPAAKSLAESD